MTSDEIAVMAGHLAQFHKSRKDWEEYRRKIDNSLLAKMAKVMCECYDNGFVWPVPDGETISWSQMVDKRRSDRAKEICKKYPIAPLTTEMMRNAREGK